VIPVGAASVEKKTGIPSLVTVGILVLILMGCLAWSFRTGDVIAGTFQLDEVQICEELDDFLQPVNASRNLPGGAQQACLWFRYSKARDGDSLEISWRLDERVIQKETFRLSEPRGMRAFYLLKEDGSALDAGFYTILIHCNGREKQVENFAVAPLSDDVSEDVVEFLD
jgi:hypothetical protein